MPLGISIIRSSAAAPDLFFPEPGLPFLAINTFLFWKSIKVFLFLLTRKIISPPFPPSPPSGPPNGMYFSLRKLDAPAPPFPALTSRKASSIKFVLDCCYAGITLAVFLLLGPL